MSYILQDEALNGFAVVQNEDYKYGYINEQGEEVIACAYDYCYNFSATGFAVVTQNERMGLIDTKGNFVLKPEFLSVDIEMEGKFAILHFYIEGDDFTRDYKFFNLSTKKISNILSRGTLEVVRDANNNVCFIAGKNDSNNLFGIIDANDNILVPFEYHQMYVIGEFIIAINHDTGFYQLFDIKGKAILPPNTYQNVDFTEDNNHIQVSKYQEEKETYLYGLFDLTGKEILPCVYAHIKIINENMIIVCEENDTPNENDYLVIDFNQKVLSPKKYAYLDIISDKYQILRYTNEASDDNQKFGLMDFSFNEITKEEYVTQIYMGFDFDVEMTILSKFSEIEGVLPMGVFDFKTKKIVLPAEYDNIHAISKDYLSVRKGNPNNPEDNLFFGIFDAKTFKEVLPVTYPNDFECVFGENENLLGFVTKNKENKKGMINLQQKTLIPFEFDEIYPYYDNQNQTISVLNYIYYNKKGIFPKNELVDSVKDTYNLPISFLENGEVLFEIKNKNEEKGFANEKMEIVIPMEYAGVYPVKENLCVVAKSGAGTGVINLKNEVIVPFEYAYAVSYEYKDGYTMLVSQEGYNYVVFDTKGNNLTSHLQLPSLLTFVGEHCIVYQDPNNNHVQTLYNLQTKQKIVLEGLEQYTAQYFRDGVLHLLNQSEYPYKSAFVNTKGERILQEFEQFENAEYEITFEKGYAHFIKPAQEGEEFNQHIFVKPNGEIITKYIAWQVCYGSENAFFYIKSSGWGLVDAKGNELVRDGHSENCQFITPTKAIFKEETSSETLYRIYDTETKELKEIPYQISVYSNSSIDNYVYEENGKYFIPAYKQNSGEEYSYSYGFINEEGEEVIPFEYDEIFAFKNGLASVKKGELWGVINTKNEIILPIQYEKAEPYNGAFGVASKSENYKISV